MAQRTNTAAVQAVLGGHYDGSTDLETFIDYAWPIVDAIAANDSGSLLSAAMLLNIETLIAADYYCITQPLANSEKIGQSSQTTTRRTSFWEAAVRMDLTGYLARLGKSPVKIKWLGTRRSNETEYVDRD